MFTGKSDSRHISDEKEVLDLLSLFIFKWNNNDKSIKL